MLRWDRFEILLRALRNSRGRALVQILERRVEAADAAEAGCHRDLGHRKVGFIDQLFREVNATGLRDGYWSRAQISQEQAPQMPRADSQSVRKIVDAAVVERAFADEFQGSRNGRGCAEPGWGSGRSFGSAAQAGAESGFCGSGGGRVVSNVFDFGRGGGADGSAVDSRRGDADEEAAVEAGIASQAGSFAGFFVELYEYFGVRHDLIMPELRPEG